MLQAIHDKAKGWVAYAIIGFISIPFALWGINSYFGGGGPVVAAVVNGEEIPAREVQVQLTQIRRQFGNFAANMDENMLKNMALDAVINRSLLRQKTSEQAYKASIAAIQASIASDPSFQVDGRFDPAQYSLFLRRQGYSEAQFERIMLDNATLQQFQAGLNATGFVTKKEAELYQSLQNQQRELELFTLKAADFESEVNITAEQVMAYYNENKAQFMTEEKAKLAYIDIEQEKLAAGIELNDELLQNYFEENADRYTKPPSRNVSHIVINVDNPAQDEQAKAQVETLYQAINAGEKTFEQVAKESSQDTLSAEQGGLVGEVVAGEWDPEFEKAVFSLAQGVVSEPVKTGVGYEIIRVNSITEATQIPYAEVKDRVEDDYRRAQADKLFYDKVDQVQTLAYEQSGDLTPAANVAGLSIQETDWLSRNQGEGIASNPKVREAAFSDEVMGGRNSELVELGDTHVVVVRQIDRQVPEQRPLDEVRDSIVASLRNQEARKLAEEKGKALLEQARQSDLSSAVQAAGKDSAAIKKTGKIGRSGSKLEAAVLETAFAMPQPAAGQASWDGVVLPNGDYTVMALLSVDNGNTAVTASDLARFSSQLTTREVSAVLEAMREQAEIERFPENI
ncbi:MAG: hypothetical protein CR991_05605 [Proteobacteria bacterium]|nr:MAG: hypothetical protein CR991_05605 [Pseudomonadota bacterium]